MERLGHDLGSCRAAILPCEDKTEVFPIHSRPPAATASGSRPAGEATATTPADRSTMRGSTGLRRADGIAARGCSRERMPHDDMRGIALELDRIPVQGQRLASPHTCMYEQPDECAQRVVAGDLEEGLDFCGGQRPHLAGGRGARRPTQGPRRCERRAHRSRLRRGPGGASPNRPSFDRARRATDLVEQGHARPHRRKSRSRYSPIEGTMRRRT